MRILYLTTPSFFDLEISYIRELSKLAEVKVIMMVAPICMKSSAFSIDKIMPSVDIIPAVRYHGMEKYGDMINLEQWYIANDITDFSLKTSFILAKKINAFIKAYKPDIIHNTSLGTVSTFLTMLLDYRIPKILSIHDVVPHGKEKTLKRKIKDFLLTCQIKKYKNLLLYSTISDKILESRLSNISYRLYHSRLGAYDFLTFYPECVNQYGEYMLFFGRIDQYKGVDILLEAYKKSELQRLDVKLIIAGKDLTHITEQINDDNIIVLNRYIENDELSNLIRHSLFVVLPYRTATQSGVTKSAYALNKPILCSNAGNLPIEVIDGKYGRVVESCDVEKLSGALKWMVLHKDELGRFSKNIDVDWNGNGCNSWATISKDMYDNVYSRIVLEKNQHE